MNIKNLQNQISESPFDYGQMGTFPLNWQHLTPLPKDKILDKLQAYGEKELELVFQIQDSMANTHEIYILSPEEDANLIKEELSQTDEDESYLVSLVKYAFSHPGKFWVIVLFDY